MKKYLSLALAVGAMAFGSTAFAAADADVLATAASVASTTAENIKAVLTANVPTLVVVGVLILSIFMIWRLGKRFLSGR